MVNETGIMHEYVRPGRYMEEITAAGGNGTLCVL